MSVKTHFFILLFLCFIAFPLTASRSVNGTEASGLVSDEVIRSVPWVSKNYISGEFGDKELDSLRILFGNEKEIPEAYELPILLALSHYPELWDEAIVFKVTNAKYPAATRPKIGNLLTHHKSKRTYVMIISERKQEKMQPYLLKNLHLNAQIGLIGHELGHVCQYRELSKGKVMGMAFGYMSLKKREEVEKDADLQAIRHGLGWQLYDWASTIREGDKLLSEDRYINRMYLTPGKIKGYMWQSGYYENRPGMSP